MVQDKIKKLRLKAFNKANLGVGLAALLLVALVFFALYAIRQHVSHPLSGDEPHYLLMDYSLKVDNDLDLKNNYTNLDYFRYYPDYITNHVSPLNLEREGGWYSFHGIGLPLILLPGFLIDERTMPMLSMIAVSVMVLILTYVWSHKLTKSRAHSLVATFLLACCYFFNGLAGYIYPDLVVAAIILGLLIIVTFYFDRRWAQLIFGVLLGLMVIVHPKTLALVIPFVAIGAYLHYRKTKTLPWFVVLGGLPFAILFFLLLWDWYGTLNPAGIYPTYLGVVSPFMSIPASLVDSQRGMLVYNPVLILLFAGVVVWWRASRKTLLITLLAIAPAYIVTLCFSEWWGGYAPTGRYLMNYIPAVMPAIAFLLIYIKKWYEHGLVTVLALATIVATFTMSYMRISYPSDQIRSELFVKVEDRIGIALDRVLPHYTLKTELIDQFGIWKVIAGLIVIVAFIYFGYVVASRVQNKPVLKKPKL